MDMPRVKSIAINYVMFVNPFATNVVKTAQIHSWWYEEIARIYPAQQISHPPHAYISVVNELSQQLFSVLTWCIWFSQRLHAAMQQCYTATSPQLTLFMDFGYSCLQRSGKW